MTVSWPPKAPRPSSEQVRVVGEAGKPMRRTRQSGAARVERRAERQTVAAVGEREVRNAGADTARGEVAVVHVTAVDRST